MAVSLEGILKGAGRLVTDELLGLDDFARVLRYTKEGDFLRALKSLGAGTFELGSTIIPGGSLVKGAKVAKGLKGKKAIVGADLLNPRMPYTRLLRAIPGATAATTGGTKLTPKGLRGMQALRAAETAQWADVGNTLLGTFGAPALPVGSIRGVRATAQQEALDADRARALGQAMMAIGAPMGGMYEDPAEAALRIVAAMRGGY